MSDIAQYGSWSVEAATEAAKELNTKGKEALFMKLETGLNAVRFMPPATGTTSPFAIGWQHYLRVPGAERPVVFPCPMKLEGRNCPSCSYANKLSGTGNNADRQLANVIDREDEQSGPKVLAFGKMIYEALIKLRVDKYAGGDFTDPEAGFDIVIDRTGSGRQDTRYDVRAARQSTKLGEMGWLQTQHDLSRFTTPPSDEELRNMISEATGGSADFGNLSQPASPQSIPSRSIADDLGKDNIPF